MEGKKCWASKYPAVICAPSTARENTESKQNFLLSKSVRATSYSQKMAVNFREDEGVCAFEPRVFKVHFKPVFI